MATEDFLEHHLSYQWHRDRLMWFTSGKPMSIFIPFSIYFHVFNDTVLQKKYPKVLQIRGQTNSSVAARLTSLPCLPPLNIDILFVISQCMLQIPVLITSLHSYLLQELICGAISFTFLEWTLSKSEFGLSWKKPNPKYLSADPHLTMTPQTNQKVTVVTLDHK